MKIKCKKLLECSSKPELKKHEFEHVYSQTSESLEMLSSFIDRSAIRNLLVASFAVILMIFNPVYLLSIICPAHNDLIAKIVPPLLIVGTILLIFTFASLPRLFMLDSIRTHLIKILDLSSILINYTDFEKLMQDNLDNTAKIHIKSKNDTTLKVTIITNNTKIKFFVPKDTNFIRYTKDHLEKNRLDFALCEKQLKKEINEITLIVKKHPSLIKRIHEFLYYNYCF